MDLSRYKKIKIKIVTLLLFFMVSSLEAAVFNVGAMKIVNTWRPTAPNAAIVGRSSHVQVWANNKMLIWGGVNSSGTLLNDGYIYDPKSGTWSAMSTSGAPAGRTLSSGVWTGTKFIIWGGISGATYLNNGAAYDIATNTWSPISTTGAPTVRAEHSTVWTGTEMIVWGGTNGSVVLNNGHRYNPTTNTWAAISSTGVPSARSYHRGIWTGSKMIIWGGYGGAGNDYQNTGGIYDLATNTWSAMATPILLLGRYQFSTIWTGSEMIVWGGWNNTATNHFNDGARYNLATNSWAYLPTTSLSGRRSHYAAWTGKKMIIWGGYSTSPAGTFNDGAFYDPTSNQWNPMPAARAPSVRFNSNLVDFQMAHWTGTNFIVWGGRDQPGSRPNDGGIF